VCFFPDRLFCFFRKNYSENSINFANVFGNICQIFGITKLEKRKNPSYPAVKCKSQGVLMQFWILLFFDFNNIWWETFLPTSSFTSVFKVAWSINQILFASLRRMHGQA